MSFSERMRAEARLIILKSLKEQADERLNSELLRFELETFGITKPREWVHGELRWMATMEVITLVEAGTVLIATLAEPGARHLAREIAVEGIKRPSRPEA